MDEPAEKKTDPAAAWKARYDSLAKNIAAMERQVANSKLDVKIMEAQKKQWEAEKVHQQQVIQKQIDVLNRTNQEQAVEIERLRAILREARLDVN